MLLCEKNFLSFFQSLANQREKSSFDMMNLLALNDHLIIPKPWGPRVSVADATNALRGLAGITDAMIAAADLNGMRGEWYWTKQGESLVDIATQFGVTETKIRADNGSHGINAAGEITVDWRKLWIWEDSVDIFEAFVAVKLRNIGLTVHFVDDWEWYHSAEGEIHCGTNVKRTPPELTHPQRWWDNYDELAAVPNYSP